MNPLESLLQPVARLLNRNIGESTPARELCQRLNGKVVAFQLRDTAFAAYIAIEDYELSLSTESDSDPDVIVTGSLVSLALMAGEDSIRDGSLEISGDAATAQAFQQLLRHAKPECLPGAGALRALEPGRPSGSLRGLHAGAWNGCLSICDDSLSCHVNVSRCFLSFVNC